jgi:hypothetical protein
VSVGRATRLRRAIRVVEETIPAHHDEIEQIRGLRTIGDPIDARV